MLSLILSTIAFFIASYLIKRYMDDADIPKGITRSTLIFSLALAIACGVTIVVDRVAS
ncbi:MAG: hypothetical protein ACREA9_09825 [Pyrinomonadaceae bacterium]